METIVVRRAVCWCLGWLIISRSILITSFAIYHQIWKMIWRFTIYQQSALRFKCISIPLATPNPTSSVASPNQTVWGRDCDTKPRDILLSPSSLNVFWYRKRIKFQHHWVTVCVPFSLSPSSGALSSQKIPLIPAFVENDLFVYVRIRLSSSNNIKLALSHLKIWLLLRNIARSPSHIHLRSGVAALAALIMETN